MCCSLLGQILFGAVMVVALGLTLASMFTPGWRSFNGDIKNLADELSKFKIPNTSGIFPFLCSFENDNTKSKSNDPFSYCDDWWKNLALWEKAVIACLVIALLLEVVAVVWTLISLCACCCKTCFTKAYPIFAVFISIFLAGAVVTYAIQNKYSLNDIKVAAESLKDKGIIPEVGYSFYLAVGALAAALVDIVVGSLTVALAKHCL